MTAPGLCLTCRGAGSLYTSHLEWWTCPACGGAGARFLFGPPIIGPKTRRKDPS